MSRNEIEKKDSKHQEDLLFLDRRQVSLIISALILLIFFTFIAGYFWGKRYALEPLVHQATYDSFADQAYCASLMPSGHCTDKADDCTPVTSSSEQKVQQPDSSLQAEKKEGNLTYCALLAGFGSQYNAQRLVDRLASKNIAAQLKKRLSKTPKGRVVAWYQVVTKPYTDKNQLQDLVDKIEKIEKIKNIKIVVLNVDDKGNA